MPWARTHDDDRLGSAMRTLHGTFDPRRNSFDLLRLLFAATVAVSHGLVLQTGWQPKWGVSTLGDFGLDGFFILSGFLVTRSFLTLDSFPRFVWHRFLRIMPGFWVCLVVVALAVAPAAALLRGLPATTPFTGDPSAIRYVIGNAGLLIVQYDIAGILVDRPRELSFNGALWTLFFEAFCYTVVAALGVLGVLRRRTWVVAGVAAVLAVLTVLQEAGLPVWLNDRVLRLLLVFLLGALAHLYAHRIPMHGASPRARGGLPRQRRPVRRLPGARGGAVRVSHRVVRNLLPPAVVDARRPVVRGLHLPLADVPAPRSHRAGCVAAGAVRPDRARRRRRSRGTVLVPGREAGAGAQGRPHA
ncbi:hypothetical protein BJF90_19280 [Pseudonocardia sp. CNS-004]|nr:hypothetical protein BJF90_19280 [Pseudonocardia sp. CNS-004]